MSFLVAKDLHFRYGSQGSELEVLKGMDLEIERGEFVGLSGASGSGKSTLFHILGCMLSPSSGFVSIDGKNLAEMTDNERSELRNRKIGFVFQQFHLLPRANVLQNVLLPTHYPISSATDGIGPEKRALELIHRFGLSDRVANTPSQLSGGQQQRVAIARALVRDAELILADEPTGNLDAQSARDTMEFLAKLNEEGRTVVVISHDPETLRHCGRIIHLQHGKIVRDERKSTARTPSHAPRHREPRFEPKRGGFMSKALVRTAVENLLRNRTRSLLTMLGVVIGVASLHSVVTLGSYTESKLLTSYQDLGVTRLEIHGYKKWRLAAAEPPRALFEGFNPVNELGRLKALFPEIIGLSPNPPQPVFASAGGIEFPRQLHVLGVWPDYLRMLRRPLSAGRNLTDLDDESERPVCVVGEEIARNFFGSESPLGKVVAIRKLWKKARFACRIVGVLGSGHGANLRVADIFIPYSFMNAVEPEPIADFFVEVRAGESPQALGEKVVALFRNRYGTGGDFEVASDVALIRQMKSSLLTFRWLLSAVALIALAVGGIGISNMMYASIAERTKEIGLRRAVGATRTDVRNQVLVESVILSMLAGTVGLAFGFVASEGVIFVAGQFVPQLTFAWVFDPIAWSVAAVSMMAVGALSGLAPARKAERIDIAEALRAE